MSTLSLQGNIQGKGYGNTESPLQRVGISEFSHRVHYKTVSESLVFMLVAHSWGRLLSCYPVLNTAMEHCLAGPSPEVENSPGFFLLIFMRLEWTRAP